VDFLTHLFNTSDFPARWTCGRWTSGHGWLHILSDLGVWSAYVAIPCVLLYFILQHKDLPFRKIFLLFGAFILLCGTTHLMEAVIFWWPAYRLAGVIKLCTAIVSWATVIALVPIVPRVLEMRSPDELEREIAARKLAEESLHRANADLEERVQKRTTELTQAVAALRDERELLHITLASIGDGVIVTDAEGRITFLNSVAENLTEWTTATAKGVALGTVFHIVNEETRLPVDNPAIRALQEGVIVGLANHTVLIGKDATEHGIDDSAAPIRDGQGQVVGCVLVFRDISERRMLEQQKTERLANTGLLASIVEFSEDAIIRKSLDGTIQSWNLAAQRLFGYAAAEAVGRNISMIVPADRSDEERQIITRLLSGEHVNHFDTVRLRKDGSSIDVALTISPIKDENGQIIGISKTARDITEEKEAEKRIYGLMTELKDADRRKDEFLATLAHELRNPLAPIRNSLEVMKHANGSGEVIEQSRAMMERQLVQMVRLVDDLLDISRITRNKVELRKQRVELASILHHAIEMCQVFIQNSEHRIELNLPPEPIYLNADPVRLAQVFSNLLNNACKFTDSKGRIELTALRAGNDALVTVKDNGIGIPPEMLPKVFEMFTQINSSLERTQGGLGIGLTLVQRLVEMHGGTVTARSSGVGTGSEFVVCLPVLLEPIHSKATEAPAVPGVTHARRILVVDDNRDSASSLAMLLKLTGHDTAMAHDGEEAVERAEVYQPNVILLDLGLPKRNGYDACRIIRQQPWGRDILMIALTGWGQEEDRRKSKEAGFDGHLVKPVSFDALVKLLSESARKINP
jgi:PAS domain S-box-containing protein